MGADDQALKPTIQDSGIIEDGSMENELFDMYKHGQDVHWTFQ